MQRVKHGAWFYWLVFNRLFLNNGVYSGACTFLPHFCLCVIFACYVYEHAFLE